MTSYIFMEAYIVEQELSGFYFSLGIGLVIGTYLGSMILITKILFRYLKRMKG